MPYLPQVKTSSTESNDIEIVAKYDGSGNVIEDTYATSAGLTTVSNNHGTTATGSL